MADSLHAPKKLRPSVPAQPFDVHTFLDASGVSRNVRRFPKGSVIFAQGADADSVFYIQKGAVKRSVLAPSGKGAIVAIFGPGDFIGEGCLAGQEARIGAAEAMSATTALCISRANMKRTLHQQHDFSDRFIAHMLARNIRVEEDLVDQLFNSSEKRLARTLLLLARYGSEDTTVRTVPHLSQETMAEMVGTTRSRVNFFMNKFRRLGFIEYNGGLKINNALLSVVLHD